MVTAPAIPLTDIANAPEGVDALFAHTINLPDGTNFENGHHDIKKKLNMDLVYKYGVDIEDIEAFELRYNTEILGIDWFPLSIVDRCARRSRSEAGGGLEV